MQQYFTIEILLLIYCALVGINNKLYTMHGTHIQAPSLMTYIYRAIHKSVKYLKIHNKYTTQRIVVVLTLIERETLQVFFFYIFRRRSICPPLVIRQSISFHTRVSISRSPRATVAVSPSGKSGQLCGGLFLKKLQQFLSLST